MSALTGRNMMVRAVLAAAGLAVLAAPAAAQTLRDTRPVRGAWLRPPSTLSALETTIQGLANAGITDLFLETLYWGQATNRSNVFPRRTFSGTQDYLADSIRIAAKYGMRVQAWTETGYLAFGSSNQVVAANPSWQVRHVDPANTTQGDIAGQIFVNLGNPGVRTMIQNYFRELANVTGLWGIQSDYHLMPLAPSGTAPFSYDDWARTTFAAQFPQFGDPRISAANSSGPGWTTWFNWNMNNYSQALNLFQQAVNEVNSGIDFSVTAFADWNGATHRSKMIDLPTWGANNYAEFFYPMSYFTSTTSIRTDVQRAKTALPGKRIVVGLAITTNITRPTLTAQLNAIRAESIEDFAIWEAPTLANSAAVQTEMRSWITGTAIKQRGDFNADGYIDGRDRNLFLSVFVPNTAIPVNPGNSVYNLNGDGVINNTDKALFDTQFRKWRFGDDNVCDQRDLNAFLNCWTGPLSVTPPAVLNLYDMDADGDVDYADQLILHSLLTVTLPADTDVNRDGRFSDLDLYLQNTNPIDVNRNGVIDGNDTMALEAALRVNEINDMRNGRNP
ncbi:MAG: family 10 glycosylhydrolase [Planctomycetota bacterium]|nr:family 10 glycosylhydrolase [Planctomycetota bacterium]